MHPLDGPRLKVRRAKSEIKTLRTWEETLWNDSKCEIVRAEFNPKTRKYVYRARVKGPPLSLAWGIRIGEIAHNLRSALDGLVWQLALLKSDTPAGNTQFPIFILGDSSKSDRQGKTFRAKGLPRICSLRSEHQTRIERLQPYKRGNGGRASPLHWLHEINNADKHRVIQVVGVKSGGITMSTWGDLPAGSVHRPRPVVLINGAKILEAAPEVHVNPNISPLVAFWKGCTKEVRGIRVVSVLNGITHEVGRIIESFGSEFPS